MANMHVSSLNQCVLGKEGVEEILPIGTLSKFEQEALEAMLPTLRADIELGEKFING